MKKIFVLVSLIGLVFVLGCIEKFFNPEITNNGNENLGQVEVYNQPQEKVQSTDIKDPDPPNPYIGFQRTKVGIVEKINGRNITLKGVWLGQVDDRETIDTISVPSSVKIFYLKGRSDGTMIPVERKLDIEDIKVGDELYVVINPFGEYECEITYNGSRFMNDVWGRVRKIDGRNITINCSDENDQKVKTISVLSSTKIVYLKDEHNGGSIKQKMDFKEIKIGDLITTDMDKSGKEVYAIYNWGPYDKLPSGDQE